MTPTLQRELLDLVLPTRCAACRTRGPVVCRRCSAGVAAARYVGGPRRVRPTPCPPDLPETWAIARLDGEVRTLLSAYKDDGRRDLAVPLGRLLAESVRASVAGATTTVGRAGAPVLVPVPTSWRSRRLRGDRPLEGLAVVAAGMLPGTVRVARILRVNRPTRDQAGLDHRERAANVRGSMVAVPGHFRDAGRDGPIVLVDDIVTTGATLVEAARALAEVGLHARAAVVAATPRRPVVSHPFPD